MDLDAWAKRWGVPLEAVAELRGEVLADGSRGGTISGGSETAVQGRVRLAANQAGGILWRNNVGAGYLQDGRFIRWGLANESEKENKRIKSSDLVGIQPIRVTLEMVGSVFGLFTAREVKAENWRFRGTKRELAQQRFLDIINTLGGNARFTTGG